MLLGASASPAGAEELIGSLHEHSGYSDGWAGSTPATYYASGKDFGLDFMGGSDHSDSLALPLVLSEECLGSTLPQCLLADGPINSFRKWDATQEQAEAATDADFTAFRGFEWTSDRFGHINVFFSANNTNAKTDGGYVAMETFWEWLTNPARIGGGADGIGVFNHPDGKKLSDADPGVNWNDFEYVPAADRQMVGIEVFNDHDAYDPWYPRALDAGWHVGAIGGEDLGHRRADDWGGPSWAKTVIDAPGRSASSIRQAMSARHFYAVRDQELRLDFTVDGERMGSRISPDVGESLAIEASVSGATTPKLDLVTSGGTVVATGDGTLDLQRPASLAEDWYFVRVSEGDEPVAYSSPVWVEALEGGEEAGARWLAGDLHVHTCFSHDVFCPPDDNTGPEEFYTAGFNVDERYSEAASRGLDFLAVTDHNDLRSIADPGFGGHGLIGIPAYENSLNGHAQMLGARRIYDAGDKSAAAVNEMADDLRDDGGLLQLNHPTNDDPGPFDDCGPELDWTYGLDIVPDVIEVWNSSAASLPESIAYWERCWLDRGERIPATGGSDSHWAALAGAQGAGNPTTWVLSDDATEEGVLDGIAAGRTTISRLSPAQGGARLLLEADADGDGTYEAMIGDTVPPNVPLRVRVEGDGVPTGLVRVRANGETIVDDVPLPPGGTMAVPPVAKNGWVRAELRFTPAQIQETFRCGVIPVIGELPCPIDQALAAMTSPIWIESSPEADDPPAADPTPPLAQPDDQPPVGPDVTGPAERPRIVSRRGIRNARRGAAVRIARLQCGSQPCRVKVQRRPRLGGAGVHRRVHAQAPRLLAANAKAPLRLKIRDRLLPRLGDEITRLRVRVRISSDSGVATRRLLVRVRGPRGR